jgi:hypothetical protein
MLWTRNWVEEGAPRASTTWRSWVRKTAATAVATTLPLPPVNGVPPTTTAAMTGSR